MSQDGAAPRARQLIAGWLAEPPAELAGEPGLRVPEAPAPEVIAAARRIAVGPGKGDQLCPTAHPDLLRLAAALVVDEHPSAASWRRREREELTAWVAVLIERRGEDGIQALLYALNERSAATD
ncbi:hypothetical protein [Kitasatospora azatica]|uniref:hypothetical protein n=1 Tax=Kitasatospora azatica TaxID=58347 RepID=UPI00055E97E0|nr:hypothetical protein [Kitasatospora azatica]